MHIKRYTPKDVIALGGGRVTSFPFSPLNIFVHIGPLRQILKTGRILKVIKVIDSQHAHFLMLFNWQQIEEIW